MNIAIGIGVAVGTVYLIKRCCFSRNVEVGADAQKRTQGAGSLTAVTPLAFRDMDQKDPVVQVFNEARNDDWCDRAHLFSSSEGSEENTLYQNCVTMLTGCVNRLIKEKSLSYSNGSHKLIIERLLNSLKVLFDQGNEKTKIKIAEAVRGFVGAINFNPDSGKASGGKIGSFLSGKSKDKGIETPEAQTFLRPHKVLLAYGLPTTADTYLTLQNELMNLANGYQRHQYSTVQGEAFIGLVSPIIQFFDDNINVFRTDDLASSSEKERALRKTLHFSYLEALIGCVDRLKSKSLSYDDESHRKVIKRLLSCFKKFFDMSDDAAKARISRKVREFLSAVDNMSGSKTISDVIQSVKNSLPGSKSKVTKQEEVQAFLSPYEELRTYGLKEKEKSAKH